jgi:hypothetical protein
VVSIEHRAAVCLADHVSEGRRPAARRNSGVSCLLPSQSLRAKLQLLSDGDGQQLLRLQEENTGLRRDLSTSQRRIAELEQQLAGVGGKFGMLGAGAGLQGGHTGMLHGTLLQPHRMQTTHTLNH